jgi:hypothetical protein
MHNIIAEFFWKPLQLPFGRNNNSLQPDPGTSERVSISPWALGIPSSVPADRPKPADPRRFPVDDMDPSSSSSSSTGLNPEELQPPGTTQPSPRVETTGESGASPSSTVRDEPYVSLSPSSSSSSSDNTTKLLLEQTPLGTGKKNETERPEGHTLRDEVARANEIDEEGNRTVEFYEEERWMAAPHHRLI